jgi:hypothetical protein
VVARPRSRPPPLTPHELKEHWLNRALERAGIDRSRWRPAAGVDANRATIEAVYRYYGALCVEHPELQWAGMASLIGPAFYAGFMDVALLRLTGGDVFYETTFLTMQKQIFEDQATMHEAYVTYGVLKIEELYRARIIDAATLEAWRQIDAGRRNSDLALVDRGNRTLLFREPFDIIDRFYLQMLRYHWPEGPAFTYLLTLAGAPSVPGADSYPERYPLTLVARLPRAAISLRTPLADGNIAVFANRWKLIDDDTLPDYLAFVRDHAGEARALVATPISQRMTRYRLLARAGRLVAAALTRWDVQVGPLPAHPRLLAVAGTKPLLAAETGGTAIDLSGPPTRESVGFLEGTDSRVWMNPNRRPFDVTVALPGGRSYHALAELAVMLSSARAGDPDRLTVQLPSSGLEATERLLTQYAAEWGFPTDAVAGWRTGAARRPSSDRDYSTHVFTPDDVGVVHLELQVSHHVRENDFVVAALFSWERHLA